MAVIRQRQTADIKAPRDRVFAYRLDFSNLPDYNPSVTNLRRIDAGTEPGPGAEYVFELTLPGADPMETPLRVLEAVPPERILFETGPGYMARESCEFLDAGSATRAAFEITITFPGEVDEATRQFMEASTREQAAMELELIKKALES